MSDAPRTLSELASELDDLLAPRDGAPGRDGIDGRDGRDADPEMVRALIEEALADRPVPRDGRDADPAVIRLEVERAVGDVLRAAKSGANGDVGADGEVGPMPRHEWDGTKLRFEQADGTWGEWVNLRGPRGATGPAGGGNSTLVVAPANSYFPSGW